MAEQNPSNKEMPPSTLDPIQLFTGRCLKHFLNFVHGLRFDTAAAEYGGILGAEPKPLESLNLSLPSFPSDDARRAVRIQIPQILASYCIMQMVTRFEMTAWSFMSARTSAEFAHSNKRLPTQEEWLKLMEAHRKLQLQDLCLKAIVQTPSATLKDFSQWLNSIVKIRNCLAHRCGRVAFEDILSRNPKYDQMVALGSSPALTATWMTIEISLHGTILKEFPTKSEHLNDLVLHLGTTIRTWPLHSTIKFTSEDCVQMATTLTSVCQRLYEELCLELREIGLPEDQRIAKPETMIVPELHLEWKVKGPDGTDVKKSGVFRHTRADWVDVRADPNRSGLPKPIYERFKDVDPQKL